MSADRAAVGRVRESVAIRQCLAYLAEETRKLGVDLAANLIDAAAADLVDFEKRQVRPDELEIADLEDEAAPADSWPFANVVMLRPLVRG